VVSVGAYLWGLVVKPFVVVGEFRFAVRRARERWLLPKGGTAGSVAEWWVMRGWVVVGRMGCRWRRILSVAGSGSVVVILRSLWATVSGEGVRRVSSFLRRVLESGWSSSVLLIQAAVGSGGGSGCLPTKRSGVRV
jgi:transposase